MCVGGGWLWVSDVENWLLMVATLSVKKLAKSLAVGEEVEGGGGGQIKEEEVVNDFRVSEVLLILF